MKHIIECRFHPSSEGLVLKGTHYTHHIDPNEVVMCDAHAAVGEEKIADVCVDTGEEGIWHYCQGCWDALEETPQNQRG